MNAQEIFDKVVVHLNNQGHPARDMNGACVYLAPNGDMCAVGCLLGDRYRPTMERTPAETLVDNFEFADLKPHADMLQWLQHAHDVCKDVADLKATLALHAASFKLKFDEQMITTWQG